MSGMDTELSGETETVTSETPVTDAAPVTETPAPAPTPAPVSAPQAAPEAPAMPMVPLTAILDVRDKYRATQAELAEYRRREAEERARKESQAAEVPNMLDDPQAYHDWVVGQFDTLNKGFSGRLDAELTRQRINISTRLWQKELGPEKFKELHEFTATMPPNWVRHAESQDDPYGFAYEEFEKRQKIERAKKLEQELGGEDLSSFLEKKKQEWLASNAPAPSADETPEQVRVRDATGKFISPSEQQRHQPPSLAVVQGAPAPKGADARSGYDALFKRG